MWGPSATCSRLAVWLCCCPAVALLVPSCLPCLLPLALQEPLSEDGTVSPNSALCPMMDASEASDDSPSALARAQQGVQAANGGVQGPAVVEAAAAAAAAAASTAEEAEEGVPLALREASIRQSIASVYYDASEVLQEEVSSTGMPAAAAAEAAPAGLRAELPPLPAGPAIEEEQPWPQPLPGRSPLAAGLSRRAAHRRTVSTDSTASGAETPLGEDGQPVPKQPGSHRFWRRFNRDYGEWETYWDEGERGVPRWGGVGGQSLLGVWGAACLHAPGSVNSLVLPSQQTLTSALLAPPHPSATVGVEPEGLGEQPEASGVVGRALQSLEGLMRDTYYSTSILVALFLMREWLGCAVLWARLSGQGFASQQGHLQKGRQAASHGRPACGWGAAAAASLLVQAAHAVPHCSSPCLAALQATACCAWSRMPTPTLTTRPRGSTAATATHAAPAAAAPPAACT